MLAMALSLEGAHAITLVGNNDEVQGINGEIQDDTDGWVAAVPDAYPNVVNAGERSVSLQSDDVFGSRGLHRLRRCRFR